MNSSGKTLRGRESGSAIIEFGLVILPLMALLLLTLDVAWTVFAKATLQHAVREGVRYGVTGVPITGNCLNASIQQVVQRSSFGFVPSATSSSYISVTYYNPITLAQVTGSNGPAGGNVIQVAIGPSTAYPNTSPVTVNSFGPLWHNAAPFRLSVQASDVMESSPSNIPPCP
jgi:Flp pilus assembly protein TadG